VLLIQKCLRSVDLDILYDVAHVVFTLNPCAVLWNVNGMLQSRAKIGGKAEHYDRDEWGCIQ